MNRRVVISGCSGGGKSTLLSALAARGFSTVPEPGRRIVTEEQRGDGAALPWVDLAAFARRAIDLAAQDHRDAENNGGWTFFDRGLIDAAVALQHATAAPALEEAATALRYHDLVFLTPPWPEIYVNDPERPHGFEEACAEYRRLEAAYPALGYEIDILPEASIEERADHILTRLAAR